MVFLKNLKSSKVRGAYRPEDVINTSPSLSLCVTLAADAILTVTLGKVSFTSLGLHTLSG